MIAQLPFTIFGIDSIFYSVLFVYLFYVTALPASIWIYRISSIPDIYLSTFIFLPRHLYPVFFLSGLLPFTKSFNLYRRKWLRVFDPLHVSGWGWGYETFLNTNSSTTAFALILTWSFDSFLIRSCPIFCISV